MNKIAVIGLVGNSAFMSVDAFHKGGETIKANSIHYEFGGKGSSRQLRPRGTALTCLFSVLWEQNIKMRSMISFCVII